MAGKLDGKIAVITGGASGIGLATVEAFVEEGARVVVGDLQNEAGEALVTRLGADTVAYRHCDVTDEDQLKALLHAAKTEFGGLDVLFNNAGIGGPSEPIEVLDMAAWSANMDLLVKAPFMGVKHAVPLMRERGGGVIVNTSSVAGMQAGYGPATYSTAKAAVLHFSRMAAAELAADKIRVNAVCPGIIATSMIGASLGVPRAQAAQMVEMLSQGAGGAQPAGRSGQGADIANAVVFLASDAGEFVNGTHIVVDGGLTVGPPHAWRQDLPNPLFDALGVTVEQADAMREAAKSAA